MRRKTKNTTMDNKKTKDTTKTKNMTFGQAIEAMKQGKRVARKRWNDNSVFLWIVPAEKIYVDECADGISEKIAKDNEGEILMLGAIRMYTHTENGRRAILTGWLASQSDMLSEDWEIVQSI
jgi:hypothetical protein